MKKNDTPPSSATPAPALGGTHPVKQERSRQLRDRLIASGRALIEQEGFAGVSMGDIAREAGCSVGALYVRFHDKEALFDCVAETAMAEAVADIRTREAAGRYRQPTLNATIAAVIEDYADYSRRNKGMTRALYQRALQDPRYWGIVRNAGYEMTSIWAAAILASSGRADDAAFQHQVRVALRHVTSVVVYSALLIEPTRTQPPHAEQVHWLTEIAQHIISAPPPPTADRETPAG